MEIVFKLVMAGNIEPYSNSRDSRSTCGYNKEVSEVFSAIETNSKNTVPVVQIPCIAVADPSRTWPETKMLRFNSEGIWTSPEKVRS